MSLKSVARIVRSILDFVGENDVIHDTISSVYTLPLYVSGPSDLSVYQSSVS